jgi:hypothetical protein
MLFRPVFVEHSVRQEAVIFDEGPEQAQNLGLYRDHDALSVGSWADCQAYPSRGRPLAESIIASKFIKMSVTFAATAAIFVINLIR